jgi:hypothetical protein
VVWSNIVQDWVWLDLVNFQVVGPFVRDFGYEATVQLSDEFGNVLNLVVRLDPACGVSALKRFYCDMMIGCAAAGIAFGTAAVLVAVIPFGEALAWFLIGAALAAWTAAAAYSIAANDPPFPDFAYIAAISPAPRALPKAVVELPDDLQSLRSFLELLHRILAAFEALDRTKSKLVAARIDDDPDAIRMQADAYRKALGIMKMAAAHLPAAMAESLSALRARKALPSTETIRITFAQWRRQGIPAEVRELWVRNELPEADLERLESMIRSRENPDEIPPVEKAFHYVTDGLVRMTRKTESESAAILAEPELSSDQPDTSVAPANNS